MIGSIVSATTRISKKMSINRPGSRQLSRLHLHTLAYQAVMTARGSPWINTGAAAVKASLTAHRHVCADSRVRAEKSFLIMDDGFSTSQEQCYNEYFSKSMLLLKCKRTRLVDSFLFFEKNLKFFVFATEHLVIR